ncbi:MAG TPA: hypothetical protein VKI65_02045, partial [Gemmataceae bacterium]|nr:hypothetical protein [Gemmataceae bacterium]
MAEQQLFAFGSQPAIRGIKKLNTDPKCSPTLSCIAFVKKQFNSFSSAPLQRDHRADRQDGRVPQVVPGHREFPESERVGA